jgi:hypothetical protein
MVLKGDNFSAMREFVEYWCDRPGVDIDSVGNCRFGANVEYAYAGKAIREHTAVTFVRNGYEDGKVMLEEAGSLSIRSFHLDFSPNLQSYEYRSADHSFHIKGQSPKMRGEYWVKIFPERGSPWPAKSTRDPTESTIESLIA